MRRIFPLVVSHVAWMVTLGRFDRLHVVCVLVPRKAHRGSRTATVPLLDVFWMSLGGIGQHLFGILSSCAGFELANTVVPGRCGNLVLVPEHIMHSFFFVCETVESVQGYKVQKKSTCQGQARHLAVHCGYDDRFGRPHGHYDTFLRVSPIGTASRRQQLQG